MRPEPATHAAYLGPNDIGRATRDRVDRLSREIATGRAHDVGLALRSDFSDLSRQSNSVARLDADATALRLAERWSGAMQRSLGQLGEIASSMRDELDAGLSLSEAFVADRAGETLRDMAAVINATVGDRSLFGRGGLNQPIPDVDAVIADVAALASASVDYTEYAGRVEAYFAQGGAFETARLGAIPADPVDFPAGDGQTISIDVSVASREVVDMFAQFALVAGLSAGSFNVPPNSEESLDIVARLATGVGRLPDVRGKLGVVEARIEDRIRHVDAARDEAEQTIADLIGVDPYETASKLQNDLARLESLYAIIARRSQLRLTDYLR